MKKRKGQDANNRADLGLSGSTQRDLDVAEGIRNDLDRIQRDIDSARDAQRGLGFDASQVNTIAKAKADIESLNVDEAMVNADEAGISLDDATISLDDMRVNLADFSPGLVDGNLSSASEMLKGVASVRSSLYQPSPLLREHVVSGFTKPLISSAYVSQILDTRSQLEGLLGALPEAARWPSPVLPATTLSTISDMAKGFATSELLKNWQGLSSLMETSGASFAKMFADRLQANNSIATLDLAASNNMSDFIRRMNKDLVDAWRRMMPTFDAIVTQWRTTTFQTLAQFDWEAIERAARVQEARRPRTRIGFAALNAYDELYLGHPWVADAFLIDYLGIEPTADCREALWIVLREAFERNVTYPAQWITRDDERAATYLRAAVYKQTKRVERNRERPDRVWWTETDPETKKKIELPRPVQPEHDVEFMVGGYGNPADIVTSYMDDRAKALLLLYEQGSEEDKEFIKLFVTGYSQSDIANAYGWAKVQRFTRKAERWRIRHSPPIDG